MNKSLHSKFGLSRILSLASIIAILLAGIAGTAQAETSIPQTDQTPLQPLTGPDPAVVQPRYISGFGLDNTYTIFYEDRNDTAGCSYASRIYFNQTSSGPFGFAATSTATNICDTHFVVKDWPITISGLGTFSYRGWGSVDNNAYHTFYVSNDLANWTNVYYGAGMFSDPGNVLAGDSILYGFHDIVNLNGNYMGFVESAGGKTYIVWSDNGDQYWQIIAKVGGSTPADMPLNLFLSPSITGPIPTGNFLPFEVDGQIVLGKVMVPGDRSGLYLAINAPAYQAVSQAQKEAAFLNPDNWTWRDGSTGLPDGDSRVLSSTYVTGGHDTREVFTVPSSDVHADKVYIYTARYATGDARNGLGCASSSSSCLVVNSGNGDTGGGDEDPPVVEAAAASIYQLPIPLTGFAPDTITTLPNQPSSVKYSTTQLSLVIPAIGIDASITGVPLVGGNWDVTWLGDQAGYLYGSAFPTWNGNSVLTGHVVNADGEPGVFHDIGRLRWGDRILVQSMDRTMFSRSGKPGLYRPRITSTYSATKTCPGSPW